MAYNSTTLRKEEFIGGCDIVKEMFENGELKKLFISMKIIWWKILLQSLNSTVAAVLVFKFTIGKEINQINEKINYILTSDGRKEMINSLKKEMES